MKSYEIWLKSGGNLTGTMSAEDAVSLQKEIKQQRGVFEFVDGDNDEVSLIVEQIALFACRDDEETSKQVGFDVSTG